MAERETRSVRLEVSGRSYDAVIKVSRMDGELLNIKAEYEDSKRIAEETGLPLRTVIKKVEEAGWRAIEL